MDGLVVLGTATVKGLGLGYRFLTPLSQVKKDEAGFALVRYGVSNGAKQGVLGTLLECCPLLFAGERFRQQATGLALGGLKQVMFDGKFSRAGSPSNGNAAQPLAYGFCCSDSTQRKGGATALSMCQRLQHALA